MSKIQDRIVFFTNGLMQSPEKGIKFAKFNTVKIRALLDDVKRYLTQEFKGDQNLAFDSQDIRSLVTALTRVHKYVNKKSTYDSLERMTIREYKIQKKKVNAKVVDRALLCNVTVEIKSLIQLAQELQMLRSWFNHYAYLTFIIECDYEYAKKESDQALCNALEETVNELLQKV